MSPIRPLERDDLDDVCRLYERVVRSGSSDPPPQLIAYFERTLLDHPWADPDLPSLVSCDGDGNIVAFIGSHVRRLRLDNRSVRMACTGQFVADPAPEHRGVGALLARAYLKGSQDLTITDGATETIRVMWLKLGGHVVGHGSIEWVRVFRPLGTTSEVLEKLNASSAFVRSLRVLSPLFDALARVVARHGNLFPRPPAADSEPLRIDALLDLRGEVGHRFRLYPDYDEAFLQWLVRELAAVEVRGTPVWNLVRTPDGGCIGWYVYYLAPDGIAEALQVVAVRGEVGTVLDHLFWHAASEGAVALRGRVEPALLAPLSERYVLFRRSNWALVHSNEPEIRAALGCGDALLTRLDGEWWMGHHLLWRREHGPRRVRHPAPA